MTGWAENQGELRGWDERGRGEEGKGRRKSDLGAGGSRDGRITGRSREVPVTRGDDVGIADWKMFV